MNTTKYHPSIIAMADAMQEKLEKNATKKGWPTEAGKRGWKQPNCSTYFLNIKLHEEVQELVDAMHNVQIATNRTHGYS